MSIERVLAPLAEWLDTCPPLPTQARIHSLVPEGPVWTVNDAKAFATPADLLNPS